MSPVHHWRLGDFMTGNVGLEQQADQFAARGQLAEAIRLLQQAATAEPANGGVLMKLAALHRATKNYPAALAAVDSALELDPLAFLPLLAKATILDAMGEHGPAAEIYGAAAFHAPDRTELPDSIVRQLEIADARYQEFQAGKESAMKDALAAMVGLSAAEAARVERFRTNILRKTKPYHSEPTHFFYPGLREREYHDDELFDWLEDLEACTDEIRAEFNAVVKAEHAELAPYVQYPKGVPLAQWAALNHNAAWTAIHLLKRGDVVANNARLCPRTMDILRRIPQPVIPGRSPNAMFSLLAPRTEIPPHTGVANSRLLVHLPLIVPAGCSFRVGETVRPWVEGKAWVFDDTIEHEAWNPTDELRVILIADLWHPDLSQAEREACAALMSSSLDDEIADF